MKQQSIFPILFPFIVLAIPWVYLAFVWGELPAIIPTHFGIDGSPDKFGTKSEILIAPVIITITGLLMYFILRNINKIDPKKKYTEANTGMMRKLATVTTLFLSGICIFVIYWTTKGKIEGTPLLFSALGLFLAYIGNLMHSIKPNYFAGFRVPWALENEENWRKTHQLASKIWFAGGIILAIISLLLDAKLLIIFFMSIVFVMTLIPVFYSYNLFRKANKTGS